MSEADDEVSLRRHPARDIRRRRRRAAATNAHRADGQGTGDEIERIFRSAETGFLADEGAIGKRADAIRKRHDQQFQPEGPRRDRVYRNGACTLHE